MKSDAVKYFKQEPVYNQLFELFKKKYESLGRIGGTVKLNQFTAEDLEVIARFYGQTADSLNKKGKLSLEAFEIQLQKTRFAPLDLKTLLEAFFDQLLISKKEQKQLDYHNQLRVLEELERTYPNLGDWLTALKAKTPDTYWIYRLIGLSHEAFKQMAVPLSTALANMPTEYERLPMFSQRVTRNPHAFDLNTNVGRLWIHLLSVHYAVEMPSSTEAINDLLLKAHIMRDDITNFVTCANVIAETDKGIHPMWQSANEAGSVMNVPLRELVSLKSVYPADNRKQVYIVENSGVYSSILDRVPDAPLICTHGQFKLAGLMLFDLLEKAGCTLHYAGDFDPEGIKMAQRLLERHPDHAKLWKMDVFSYHKALSMESMLSEERLNKLQADMSELFIPVIKMMNRVKRAGYQEALVDDMVQELKER
ncbi:TIGR02679 family protein [Gracilibacillus salinarum]|uniref:TIGR02679 family protein n=1 Tax=Gracilibacillus salinarum TaxID=2932255 RepID=A0ABY4GH27_9BACI|nr:TIGR02679 family protein [Gracilibacillus salinarum]UOQ83562.1 TIGR02679 family protein [Gracilibacillus salinarum]